MKNTIKRHIIVRDTKTNGYEFATPETGVFSISKKEELEKYMKNKGYTFEIIQKKSRLVDKVGY